MQGQFMSAARALPPVSRHAVRYQALKSANRPASVPRPFLSRRPPAGRRGRARRAVAASQAGGESQRRDLPRRSTELPPGTLLRDGRFEVLEPLGSGSNGVTYRCADRQAGGRAVALKVLRLRSLRDWKQLELFEREAQTLKNLEHPGIPRYLEWFEEDSEEDRAFCLVQELAEGTSLEELVGSGWRADEAEVSRIAVELLQILQYLGSRRPPVVHRDVKPQNIVLEGGRTGGRVYLVDFGGVQAFSGDLDRLGTTVVGTYGFMAPESFRGAAQPESDLYSLGGTLLFLLSGRPPSAFPVDRMRLDFSSVSMGSRMEAVIDGLLEPLVEDRLTADEALELLTGQRAERSDRTQNTTASSSSTRDSAYAEESSSARRLRQPAGSKIQVVQRGPRLEIDIPPAGFSGQSVATGAFAIAWNAFVAFWSISALAGGGILFALFSLPFWVAGVQLARQAFGRQFIRERLLISPKRWQLEQQLALAGRGKADWSDSSSTSSKEAGGRTSDLRGARINVAGYVNGQPIAQLELVEGVNRYVLAEGLSMVEVEWLADVINSHLQDNQLQLPSPGGSGGQPRRLERSASSPTLYSDYANSGSSSSGRGDRPPWEEDIERARVAAGRAAQEAEARGREAAEQARRAAEEGSRGVGGSLFRERRQEGRRSPGQFDDSVDPFDLY